MNYPTLAMLTAGLLSTAESKAGEDATFIGRQTPELKERKLTPEALWAMGRIGGYDASPDTKSIVYNVSYYSVEQNKSHTVIYTIAADGTDSSNGNLLTSSTSSELSPQYINQGKQIAYMAPDNDGIMQLWTMNADGSNRKQISKLKKDIEDYQFSPDEKSVLVIHSVKYGKRTTDIYPDLPKASGRVINEAMFRHWDEWTETIPHPYIYHFNGTELATDPIDILKDEPYECPMKPFGGIEQLAWSQDSKKVAYTCRKKTGLEYATSTDSDIFLYDIETGKTTNLCKPTDYKAPKTDHTLSLKDQKVNTQSATSPTDLNLGYDTNPQFSPDGKYISWQSMERDGYESDRNRLCIYEISTGKKTYIAELFQSNVDSYCWAANSKILYFVGTWHGTTHVYATDLQGNIRKITDGMYDYTSVSLCGNLLLCNRQSMKESPELYLVNPALSPEGKKVNVAKIDKNKKIMRLGKSTYDFEETNIKNNDVTKNVIQLTHENQYFREHIDWGNVDAHVSSAIDGEKILSWIIFPPNFDESKKYPTLLFCEGGPQSPVSQFWSYRWNMQIMAANGYIVVAPNRRGLPGFGMEWLEEISTNYGGHCMDDYLSAIDNAVKHYKCIDADRLGCVGASFGGFSVYWLAGHHDKRFKCFIAHDGIFNLEQQYLETEEAWFANWDLGGAFWHKDNAAIKRTFENSPHRFVDRWDAPILCIHGEKDYRIVASQAMAAFNAARYRGIPAELLIFPDENHWVLKPQNGVLWQRRYFNWLDKWLK